MNLILIGPPGAGKGTQAKKIADKYNLVHISTGDMFRETAQSCSDLGAKLKTYMESGLLVPDDVVIEVVEERLLKKDCEKGFLLDGFPRTLAQAKSLGNLIKEKNIKINKVIYLELSEHEIVKRISNRRVCNNCGANYNLISQPPKNDEKCDVCSSQLVQRADDKEETVRNRLKVYNSQTKPLIDYYVSLNILHKIDALNNVEKVFENIADVIKR